MANLALNLSVYILFTLICLNRLLICIFGILGEFFMWARYHFKDFTKNMKLQKSDFLVIISTRLLQTFKFLTCQRGLANQLCSNPAFLFSDMSARKFQNPLKSFTSRLSESLGNNMPGNLALVEPTRRWKLKNNARRAKIDSIAAVSHAGVTHISFSEYSLLPRRKQSLNG